MFKGIKRFQKENGLKIDGLMKPDGPTERKLNDRLSAANGDKPKKTATQPQFGRNLLSMDAPAKKSKSKNQRLAMMSEKDKYARPGIDGILEGSGIKGAGGGAGSSAKVLGKALGIKSLFDAIGRELPGASEVPPVPANDTTTKMDTAPKLPSHPGFEPPKRDPKDNKEEYPANGPKVITRTEFPNLEKEKPQVFIFPDKSEQYNKPQIMEERRERKETKSELDEVRDRLIDLGYQHIGGGRAQNSGKEKKKNMFPATEQVL